MILLPCPVTTGVTHHSCDDLLNSTVFVCSRCRCLFSMERVNDNVDLCVLQTLKQQTEVSGLSREYMDIRRLLADEATLRRYGFTTVESSVSRTRRYGSHRSAVDGLFAMSGFHLPHVASIDLSCIVWNRTQRYSLDYSTFKRMVMNP